MLETPIVLTLLMENSVGLAHQNIKDLLPRLIIAVQTGTGDHWETHESTAVFFATRKWRAFRQYCVKRFQSVEDLMQILDLKQNADVGAVM